MNQYNLPQFVVNALTHSDYPDHEPNTIGVTSLIDSARIRTLSALHPNLPRDASTYVDSMLGNAVHEWFRAANVDRPATVCEERFTAKWGNVTISAQPDRVEGIFLYDLKTAKAASVFYGPKPSWEKQTNIYRWVLAQNGIPVEIIQIVVVYKDWSIGEKQRMLNSGYSYPEKPVDVINMPVWPDTKTEAFIEERVTAHFCTEMPECTAEERWAKDAQYAVHKGGKYRAERVFNTLEEAYDWAGEQRVTIKRVANNRLLDESGYYIVKRPEVWTRCEHYCPVSSVCDQWKAHNVL